MTADVLAGRQFLFDCGQNAKFLLRFSHQGEVDVTSLAGIVYSITDTRTFPVRAKKRARGAYEISWRDPAEQTAFVHHVDFVGGTTAVLISDDRLKELRRFQGTVSSA